MNIQIISKEAIQERAREAFHRGDSRDSHNMNWHAAALPTWLAEYDRLAQASPMSHGAPAAGRRADVAQVA